MTYKEQQEAYMEWLNKNQGGRFGDWNQKGRELYNQRPR